MNDSHSSTETARQAELHRFAILDTLPEAAFEAVARRAAQHYAAPIALVGFLDAERYWIKARFGASLTQAPRALTFCQHALYDRQALVVPDARRDARFQDYPLVTGEPGVRFYAGAPIVSPCGHVLGTVCVLDFAPRAAGAVDSGVLEHLAREVMHELERRAGQDTHAFEAALLAHVSDAVIALDHDLRVCYLNEAARRLYEAGPFALGRPLRELLRVRWPRPEDQRAARTAVVRGETWAGEVVHVLPSGRELPVALSVARLSRAGGRGALVATVRDVTERRAAEARLKLLESVVVHANDAVVVTEGRPIDGPDGPRVLYVNEAFTRMTGYAPEDIVGKTPRVLQGPRTSRATLDRMRAALESWTPITLELVNYRKDGTPFWVEISLAPAAPEGGWFTHWIAVQRDISERRTHEERLRLLESVAVNANDAIIISEAEPVVAPGPRVLYVNEAFARMTGYAPEDIVGQTPRLLQGAKTDRAALDRIRAHLLAWQPVQETVCNYRKDGSEFWVSLSIAPVADETGWFTHWVSIQRDVTEQRRQQLLDAARRDLLERVTRDAPLHEVLEALCAMLADAVPGARVALLRRKADRLHLAAGHGLTHDLGVLLERFGVPDVEEPKNAWANGAGEALGVRRCLSAFLVAQQQRTEQQRPLGVLALLHDQPAALHLNDPERQACQDLLQDAAQLAAVIVERYDAREEMRQLALHDHLTGLPNRALFAEFLRKALVDANRRGERVAVALLDLDRFKHVNDTFGHSAGDELLQQVAARLRAVLRADSSVARLGGDEFTLTVPSLRGPDEVRIVAERVLRSFQEPFAVAGRELYVRASLGVAVYPDDAQDPENLLSLADIAMYRAKRDGSGWTSVRQQQDEPDARRLELESELHRALPRGELAVFYQPVLNAGTRDLRGVEALVRWHHPTRGLVPPAEFIPLAEANGLITSIGEFVLQEACAQAARWQGERPELRVAVNLSARQFAHPDLLGQVRRALSGSALRPETLVLEITESALMEAPDARDTIERLRDLGVVLALDDFGTGYASLAFLKRFPMHTLKIDKSFLQGVDVDTDGVGARLVRSIAGLAANLSLTVIAEGVETESMARFCEEVGCDALQGYHFARPMPVAEADAWLARFRPKK